MNIILFEEAPSFLPLDDERSRHILTVLHLKEGDTFKGGILSGKELLVRVDAIEKEGIRLSYVEKEDSSALFPLSMILAEVRPICMKRILREVTSLGVGKLHLVISELGEKSYMDAGLYNSGEWRKIVIDGAMQSGRTGIPEVHIHEKLDELLPEIKGGSKFLFDNVLESSRISDVEVEGECTFAIGPERGWSNRERQLFLSNGFTPISLGSRILRTETASVAATSTLLMKMDLI